MHLLLLLPRGPLLLLHLLLLLLQLHLLLLPLLLRGPHRVKRSLLHYNSLCPTS